MMKMQENGFQERSYSKDKLTFNFNKAIMMHKTNVNKVNKQYNKFNRVYCNLELPMKKI